MTHKNMKLPTNCAPMSEDEMMYTAGGFTLDAPVVIAGVAAIAVGAIGLNLLNWFNGSSESNFIQDSITAGANFINGAVNAGQNFLNGLLGL
mgnify:CR=1 FL=1